MNRLSKWWSSRFKTQPLAAPAKTQDDPGSDLGGLPIRRVSLPDDLNLIALMQGAFSYSIPRKWPLQIYNLMEDLSLNNPDIRQAVGHIVDLGNTGHILGVKGNTDSLIDAAIERISTISESIFPYTSGTDGLVNALFGQIARVGATSTEWVPKNDLSGIDKVFFVPVRQIRWVPRVDRMGYYPVQLPESGVLAGDVFPLIELNTRTYHYANLETLESCPYAVPPFIAALEPVMMQRDMIKNISKVIKKMGIMGLLSYAVEPPKQHPGENEQKYHARCLTYLESVTEQIKNSFNDGIAAGFKGAFEFKSDSVVGDARGIAEIFKMNEEQLFSAISADPAMHGRTYSTTETYASVVYSKMISRLRNVQGMVASVLEFGWGLDLLLAGIPADICVEFKMSNALSNLQEAQSEMIDIANAAALYQEGVIDQYEKARRLGYAKPALAEPLPDPSLAGDKNVDQRPNTGGGTDNTQKNPKKKQPKEQTGQTFMPDATFEYNAFMRRYYPLRDVIVVDATTATLEDKGKKPDPQLQAKYRRYLQRSSRADV